MPPPFSVACCSGSGGGAGCGTSFFLCGGVHLCHVVIGSLVLPYPASDQNPLLQFLYHWVPGIKSFSEIHDMEMKVIDKRHEASGGEVPKWVPVVTIVPSFLYSFVHAGGSTLDVSNWSKNWDSYIKGSYEMRQVKLGDKK